MKAFYLISLIFAGLLFITQSDLFVRSDGFYYYHTAKTIVDKGNFVTTEKPEYWEEEPYWTKAYYDEKYVSVASPGTALLNVPALLIAKMLSSTINLSDDYFYAYNGHVLFDGILILLNTSLFFIASIILTYKTLRLLNISEKIGFISIVFSVLSSYVLWYVFLLPMFSHTYEVFGTSLLLYSFVRYEKMRKTKYLIYLLIASGILILIRPVFLPLTALSFFLLAINKSKKENLKIILIALVTSVPFLLMFFSYNLISYGNILASGYYITRSETFDFSAFNGLNILFSIHRGWLVYSPLFIFSIIGLIYLLRKYKKLGILLIGGIASGIFVYGFWPNWWGGGSFGSRFLLYTLPFCILGFAYFIQTIKLKKYFKFIFALTLLFVIYSTSLMMLYRVTPIGSDFYLPTTFFKRQLDLLNESSNFIEYIEINTKNIQSGSSFIVILSGKMDFLFKVNKVDQYTFRLELLVPPISKQSLPDKIIGYLVDKEDKLVYEATIKNIQTNQTIYLNCTNDCNSEILINKVKIDKLLISEYSGIIIDEKYDFYLENGKNIQLRGNLKPWTPEQLYFKLF